MPAADRAIEDQANNLNSIARPYDQRAFSPLDPLLVGFRTWLCRYTCVLLLISMPWHGQAIFESKGDKISSSAECRIRTQGLWNRIASRPNARWRTDRAFADQVKSLNSIACPYDQRAFSPLDPVPVGIRTWLWRYTCLFLISILWHRQAIFIPVSAPEMFLYEVTYKWDISSVTGAAPYKMLWWLRNFGDEEFSSFCKATIIDASEYGAIGAFWESKLLRMFWDWGWCIVPNIILH